LRRLSVLVLIFILLSGCARMTVREEVRQPGPREKASLELTHEGRRLLNAGKPDNAIRLLEQAIGLDPNNGQCYYYLAEAWMKKGVFSEAKEFNTLALSYLKDDIDWQGRVQMQADELGRLEKSD
jgi:Tfp pilus assembly protein PilF